MIHVLSRKASGEEIADMLSELRTYIKLAVDIRRGAIAGGGEMHADCEAMLLKQGSRQEDIWGADWYPSGKMRYESLINLRPRQGNRTLAIQDEEIRRRVRELAVHILGGVQ